MNIKGTDADAEDMRKAVEGGNAQDARNAANQRWRDSNMAAARDFRERMAQAWKDAEWPEGAR